jgi:endonuclease YncB( thermonuclease family)
LKNGTWKAAVIALIALLPNAALAEMAVVRNVIDGDTIYACGSGCYTVRILNIDAPEMPPKSKCEKEARMAVEAKARLAQTIDGQNVELVREGRQRDRFGRVLARVVFQDKDMGEMLVAAGVARRWTGRRESWC